MEPAQIIQTWVEIQQTMTFTPSIVWVFVQMIIIGLLWIWMYSSPNNWFILLFKWLIESIHNFLEEILGSKEKKRILATLTSIFFVVLFANLLGLIWDIVGQAVVNIQTWKPALEEIFQAFSSDKNATTALAAFVVILALIVQLMHLGPIKFFMEYIPFTGKNFVTVEKGNMSPFIYYPLFVFVKLFDIIISLFIGVLDIVWVFAKILSVSFRLFGNMFSGSILLWLLTAATIWLSQAIWSVDFPFLIPIILWIQSILVALVQAFVVTLLAAIFIKVAKT